MSNEEIRFISGNTINRKDPNDVFTPRLPRVNNLIYIHRPDLETKLLRATKGFSHIIIYGESGCGKTWLYRKVLGSMKSYNIAINLADASRYGSIGGAFMNYLSRYDYQYKKEYQESKGVKGGIPLAQGSLAHTDVYVVSNPDPFISLLKHGEKNAHNKPCFIILDNLEAIFNEPLLMKELGNLITLLDDSYYAKFNIKFIIVGVPSGVRAYFSKILNRSTIDNRVVELPEIRELNITQIREFLIKGFVDLLKVEFTQGLFDKYQEHIAWVTAGIPQRLHEYCLALAYLCQDNNWIAEISFLAEADKSFISQSLNMNYVAICNIMNARQSAVGRRNQILYCLSLIENGIFKSIDIENDLRSEFPMSTKDKTLSIGQILTGITSTKDSPIRKLGDRDEYEFTDPKFKMCLRAMLYKTDHETVEKYDCKDV